MRNLSVWLAVLLAAFIGFFECQNAFALMLFGDADHAEQLPAHDGDLSSLRAETPTQAPNAVPPVANLNASQNMLTAGVQQNATLARPMIEWFMIPKWMAGRWSKKGDLTLSVTDLQTGAVGMPNVWTDDVMTVHWGHQLDKAGNVWHANFIPSERDGNSDGETVRFVTVAQKCEMTASQQLVTRTRYIVTKSLGRSVEDMFQQEALNDYAYVSPNEFQNMSSNKMFRMNGQPFRIGKLSSKFTKVAEFAPVDFDRGLNMRQALADYLHAQNRDDLIPEIAAAPR